MGKPKAPSHVEGGAGVIKLKYIRLTQRDIIQQGDECRTNWGTWEQIEPEHVGKRKEAVMGWYVKMRRVRALGGN